MVKRSRVAKKTTPKTGGTAKFPPKGKGASTAQEQPQREIPPALVTTVIVQQAPPPPHRNMPSSHPQVIQTKAPIRSEIPLVRIPVEPYDLDKTPKAFRCIMYETTSHMMCTKLMLGI